MRTQSLYILVYSFTQADLKKRITLEFFQCKLFPHTLEKFDSLLTQRIFISSQYTTVPWNISVIQTKTAPQNHIWPIKTPKPTNLRNSDRFALNAPDAPDDHFEIEIAKGEGRDGKPGTRIENIFCQTRQRTRTHLSGWCYRAAETRAPLKDRRLILSPARVKRAGKTRTATINRRVVPALTEAVFSAVSNARQWRQTFGFEFESRAPLARCKWRRFCFIVYFHSYLTTSFCRWLRAR